MIQRSIIVAVLLVMVLLAGCSSLSDPSYPFNADDIQFSLIDYKVNEGHRFYTIEVRNKGKIDVKYVNLYLSYPIIVENGSKGNPFKLEGKSGVGPNHIQSEGVLVYQIDAPVAEVFGSSEALDWDHPVIEFNGIVQDGKSQVPFGMSGNYLDIK